MVFLQITEAGEIAQDGIDAAGKLGGPGLQLLIVACLLIVGVFVYLYIKEKADHSKTRERAETRIEKLNDDLMNTNIRNLETLSDLKSVFEALRTDTSNGHDKIGDKIDATKDHLNQSILNLREAISK